MKTSIIALSFFLTISVLSVGQSISPKHKNYFKSPQTIETKSYAISFTDIVAKMDYVKMAAEIKNNSNDYLIFKAEESEFIFDFGEVKNKSDLLYILPNSSIKKTLKATGGNQFHVDKFVLKMGGLYRLSSKGKTQKAEEFRLPANRNNLNAGNFKISLIKTSQRTQETYGKFEVEYIGENVGIIDPSRITVRVDGTDLVYANDIKKAKKSFLSSGGPIFLRKGEKATFKAVFHIPGRIADMQFSLLYIIWGDTFIESEPQKLEAKKINFIIDEGLTHGKN